MERGADETALTGRMNETYARARSPVMRAIERRVCGCDYGGSSWTTRVQAERVADMLMLGEDSRFLEVGAGAGWPGLYIARLTGCRADLVDLPEEGVRAATLRAGEDGLAGRVSAQVADALALPFDAATFDAIGHFDLLCCLMDKRGALAECRRVAKPGAPMGFTVISRAPDLDADQLARAAATGPDFIESETDYETLLEETGWEIEDCLSLTAAYLAACRRQVEADAAAGDELRALIGDAAAAQRMADWRAYDRAISDGLIRRDLFLARAV